MIIDSHAHITEESLREDAPRIIADMKKDGLLAIVEVGCDFDTSRDAIEIAEKNDNVFALVGTHPEFAAVYGDREREFYLEAAKHPKVIGIGEIGLDYYYETPEREVQKKAFVAQLELAHEAKLPISLHIRDAYGDLLNILKDNRHYIQHGMLMHCYCGSKEFVRELAPFDSYFAFDIDIPVSIRCTGNYAVHIDMIGIGCLEVSCGHVQCIVCDSFPGAFHTGRKNNLKSAEFG